jgi:hypothetical protein
MGNDEHFLNRGALCYVFIFWLWRRPHISFYDFIMHWTLFNNLLLNIHHVIAFEVKTDRPTNQSLTLPMPEGMGFTARVDNDNHFNPFVSYHNLSSQ